LFGTDQFAAKGAPASQVGAAATRNHVIPAAADDAVIVAGASAWRCQGSDFERHIGDIGYRESSVVIIFGSGVKAAVINGVFVEREGRCGIPADRFLAWIGKQARRASDVNPHLRSCIDRNGVLTRPEHIALAGLKRLIAEAWPDDVVVKIGSRLVVDAQG
jgi:hypothetical protein